MHAIQICILSYETFFTDSQLHREWLLAPMDFCDTRGIFTELHHVPKDHVTLIFTSAAVLTKKTGGKRAVERR